MPDPGPDDVILTKNGYGVTQEQYYLPKIVDSFNGMTIRAGFIHQATGCTVVLQSADQFAGAGHPNGGQFDSITRRGDTRTYTADAYRGQWIVSNSNADLTTGGVTQMDELADVTLAGPNGGPILREGVILTYDATDAQWKNKFASPDLGIDLQSYDPSITAPAPVYWDGTTWQLAVDQPGFRAIAFLSNIRLDAELGSVARISFHGIVDWPAHGYPQGQDLYLSGSTPGGLVSVVPVEGGQAILRAINDDQVQLLNVIDSPSGGDSARGIPNESTFVNGPLVKNYESTQVNWNEIARLDPTIGLIQIDIQNLNNSIFSITGAIIGKSCKFYMKNAATIDPAFPYDAIRFVAYPNQTDPEYFSVQIKEFDDQLPIPPEWNGVISIEGYGAKAEQSQTKIISPMDPEPGRGTQVQVLNFRPAAQAGVKNIREWNLVANYVEDPLLDRQVTNKRWTEQKITDSVKETVDEVFARYRTFYASPSVANNTQFSIGNHHTVFSIPDIPDWIRGKRIRVSVNVTIQTQSEGVHNFWLRVSENQSEVRGALETRNHENANRGHLVCFMDWSLTDQNSINIQLRLDGDSQWWSLKHTPRDGYSKIYLDAILHVSEDSLVTNPGA